MRASVFAWLMLAISVFAEVLGNLALRHAEGFTRPWPSVAVAVCYGGAIWLMSLAIQYLEMSLAYAVWAGAGTALTALVGMLWLDEAHSALRMVGLGCIVAGVITLNLGAH